jgi:hypothetical protein
MKLFLVSLFVSFCVWTQAQMTITTNFTEYGIFDEEKIDWIIESEKENTQIFHLNEDISELKHKVGSKTFTYSIYDWTFEEEEILYDLYMTNEKEEEIDLYIDGLNELVIKFYFDEKGNFRMERNYMEDISFD